jgi:hypothetical protein
MLFRLLASGLRRKYFTVVFKKGRAERFLYCLQLVVWEDGVLIVSSMKELMVSISFSAAVVGLNVTSKV